LTQTSGQQHDLATMGEERQEIERLKEELRREHEMYLRALADFDNYRRRIEREREAAIKTGKRQIVLSLIEVLDSFERALELASDAPEPLLRGLKAVYKQFLALLEAQGVTPFESAGKPFDPTLHEAVAIVKSEGQEPGRVIEEVSRGYRWGDEVIRPARVRVVQ
jgi:molecular chaperone GrpE